MPEATRKGDIGSGHGCFPPSPAIEGSPDVFINNKLAVRVGDAFAAHGCGICVPHGRAAAAGSATVNINGKAAVRIGDVIDCGGSAATGSGNVFIGDLSWGGQASLPVKAELKLLLGQLPGENAALYTDEPYELYKGGALVQKGTSDEEGIVSSPYEPPWTEELKVKTAFGSYTYRPDACPPIETEAGMKSRLDTLGYYQSDGQDNPVSAEGKNPQGQYAAGTSFKPFDGSELNKTLFETLKPLIP